ncbi:MAG: hypothetical protein ABJ249_00010, partial [Lentilitoribacter sp.]
SGRLGAPPPRTKPIAILKSSSIKVAMVPQTHLNCQVWLVIKNTYKSTNCPGFRFIFRVLEKIDQREFNQRLNLQKTSHVYTSLLRVI